MIVMTVLCCVVRLQGDGAKCGGNARKSPITRYPLDMSVNNVVFYIAQSLGQLDLEAATLLLSLGLSYHRLVRRYRYLGPQKSTL